MRGSGGGARHWWWTGALDGSGHGGCWAHGRQVSAHALGWQLCYGLAQPVAGEMPVIRRACDNASCQRPECLLAGTAADNAADYQVRRWRTGSSLADIRGSRGRAVAIREAILSASRDGASVDDAIDRAWSSNVRPRRPYGQLTRESPMFALGTTGRFLLKHEAWQRGYGLKTALNLIYPERRAAARANSSRWTPNGEAVRFIRSRLQSSRATTFEAFDVDKVREMVGGATGEPYDRRWGSRITYHFESERQRKRSAPTRTGSASTFSTSCASSRSPITTGSKTARPASSAHRIGTSGRPSWMSWADSLACGWSNAGRTGTGQHSPRKAARTFLCG